MNSGSLYEDDVLAWSEQQAAVLRGLAVSPGRLPNGLDLEHVIEEIEDVGLNQLDSVESYIRLILVHLVKLAAAPQSPAVRHWRAEIVNFRAGLSRKLTPSMHRRIDLDQLWRVAKRQAHVALELDEGAEAAVWTMVHCPLGLEAFGVEEFDTDAALRRLGQSE